MKLKQGFVHAYIGTGKGKTSAAVGLAIRAKGAGLKVCFFQFLKGSKVVSSEVRMLRRAGIKTIVFDEVHPMFGGEEQRLKNALQKDLRIASAAIKGNKYSIVILDEILNAVSSGFIKANSLTKAIKTRSKSTEIILTGRKAPRSILALADYITYFKKVSHPFEKKVAARPGIEY